MPQNRIHIKATAGESKNRADCLGQSLFASHHMDISWSNISVRSIMCQFWTETILAQIQASMTIQLMATVDSFVFKAGFPRCCRTTITIIPDNWLCWLGMKGGIVQNIWRAPDGWSLSNWLGFSLLHCAAVFLLGLFQICRCFAVCIFILTEICHLDCHKLKRVVCGVFCLWMERLVKFMRGDEIQQ